MKKIKIIIDDEEIIIDTNTILDSKIGPEESNENLKKRINRLNLKKEDKGLLASLIRKTARIRGQIVQVGKVALKFILSLAEKFPHTLCALIVGIVIKLLLSAIPLLGVILGPVLGSMIVVALVMVGVALDLYNILGSIIKNSAAPINKAWGTA
jgi:hypothetical protein